MEVLRRYYEGDIADLAEDGGGAARAGRAAGGDAGAGTAAGGSGLLAEQLNLLESDPNRSRKRLSRESMRSSSIVWEEDDNKRL